MGTKAKSATEMCQISTSNIFTEKGALRSLHILNKITESSAMLTVLSSGSHIMAARRSIYEAISYCDLDDNALLALKEMIDNYFAGKAAQAAKAA